MPIRDKSIGWKYKRLWIPIREFAGWDNNGTNDISLSQGTPTLEPITTSELAGLPMDAADEIGHCMPIPWDLDRDKPVLGRIFFQHASADADSPIFKWTTLFAAKQATMVEFIGNPDKSTTFAAHTCSTNNPSLEVTKWTELSWESYITLSDVFMFMSIELDNLGSASTDECKVLGVELAYQVKATQPHRADSEYMADENPV